MNPTADLPIYAFVDLDDSLFCSARKCPPGAVLEAAAVLQDGQTISYTSAQQRALLAWLRRGATVVPVTARSVEALARVRLEFAGPAVASFGGVILDAQRRPDPLWAAHMHTQLADARPLLAEACAEMGAGIAASGIDAWAKLVDERGQTQYLLVKHRAADIGALAALRRNVLQPWAARRPAWRVFQNDNNLVLLPPGLDKSHAVAHLMARLRECHGEILTVGLGDSISDAEFLGLCDYAMTPRHTQLSRRLTAKVQL